MTMGAASCSRLCAPLPCERRKIPPSVAEEGGARTDPPGYVHRSVHFQGFLRPLGANREGSKHRIPCANQLVTRAAHSRPSPGDLLPDKGGEGAREVVARTCEGASGAVQGLVGRKASLYKPSKSTLGFDLLQQGEDLQSRVCLFNYQTLKGPPRALE